MGRTASTLLSVGGYLFLVALGAVLGSRRAVRERRLPWLAGTQTAVLLVIILALGVQLGANDEVAGAAGAIGFTALLVAVLSMCGSLLCVFLLRRFLLRLDRFARAPEEAANPDQTAGGRADNRLTWWISAAVILGFILGRRLLSQTAAEQCGRVVTLGLDVMLFLVGLDLGRQGEAIRSLRAAGWKPLLVPLGIIVGSLSFGALAALPVAFAARETTAAAAGMGWYSLAPTILAPWSLELSAVAFLANVLRELLSILLVPIVARRIGYLESISLAGATAMDTLLPVILKSTDRRMTVYAFASGLVCSLLVPVLVPLMIGM